MSENITHTPSTKRLERSSSDRVIAGVSGGLGRYFDLNPTFFRLGFVVLTLLGGAGILIYLAAVLVLPDEARSNRSRQRLSPHDASGRGRSSDSASPPLRWQSFSRVPRSGPQPASAGCSSCLQVSQSSGPRTRAAAIAARGSSCDRSSD